jgi:integrase
MGQLKKRGRIWWIRYYRDGRRYEESSRSTKEGDARRLLRLREGDIERGLPVTPKIGRLRFDEAAKDLINDYSTNGKRTLDDVQRRLDLHLTPYFGGRRMASITTWDVRAYIAKRQSQVRVVGKGDDQREKLVSAGEINRELTALKRMLNLARQAGKLLVVPYVPMLKEHNIRTGFFEREQFESVRSHLPEYAGPIVTFAYITGWRIPSEVLPLQWRQVDFDAGEIRLDPGTTKNGEGRVFPFTADLRLVLEQQRDVRDALRKRGKMCPWVFNNSGRRVKSFRWAWDEACRLAGSPGRLLHDLRRTAVRNLVRAGIPERVAMQLTGHKTRSVFERYNIVSHGDLRSAVQTLDAVAAQATRPKRRATSRSHLRPEAAEARRPGTISGTIAKTRRSLRKG